jgi:hypothetical protein
VHREAKICRASATAAALAAAPAAAAADPPAGVADPFAPPHAVSQPQPANATAHATCLVIAITRPPLST